VNLHGVARERFEELNLSGDELRRYSRQLILPGVGVDGQKHLKAAKVLCVGAGGLGSPSALYLAAAGVGTIGLVDFDVVDATNLHRQILHGTSDIGRKKLESARDRLLEANPNVCVELHDTRLTAKNARRIVESYDVVLDGTDNFPARYLVNDVCVFSQKPNVYGSISRFEGQCSVFAPSRGGPCYRCLYPEPPPPGAVPNCAEAGVFGVLPGIIGVMQAIEAIKVISGLGEPLIGRLVHFDALKTRFREFQLRRDPACPVCSDSPSITALLDYQQFCSSPDSKKTMTPSASIPEITVEDLKARFDRSEKFVLLDVREPFELEIASLPGTINIPLGELPARLSELNPEAETLILCRSGGRSANALEFLRDSGFSKVWNVEGGINAWSRRIDPAVPLY
jgi:molybdopterin/thiamine biosynthesis adenylyltransferase/rhodanese-related sulfurtransferase